MEEQWKLFGEGDHEISRSGVVRRVTPGRGTRVGKIFKARSNNQGYMVVGYKFQGKYVCRKVHKLVAELFLGPCPDGKEVNHKDGNKMNPHVSNLEYVTSLQNQIHAVVTGLRESWVPQDTVDNIRLLARKGFAATQIGRYLGVSSEYCRRIIRGNARKFRYREDHTACDREDPGLDEHKSTLRDRADEHKRHRNYPVRCKFPQSTVEKVREMRKAGSLYREIAHETGMSFGNIGNILLGKTRVIHWNKLPVEEA